MKKQGAIVLGSGGDCCATNNNQSEGTFYEWVIVSGYPTDATETAVQANIVAAGYGSDVPSNISNPSDNGQQAFSARAHCIQSNTGAIIGYTLQQARHVSVNILDQRGRHIAEVQSGVMSAGRHEALWDATRFRAGVYVCKVEIDGTDGWAGKIVIGK